MQYFSTLVSVKDALTNLDDPNWIFVDVRYSLQDAGWGEREYLAKHIRGAVFASLNEELSGEIVSGLTGRHPLPSQNEFVEVLRRLGVGNTMQVVVYDAGSGAMAASRLWWMLRWAGHSAVAVLDGGMYQWQKVGAPCAEGKEVRARANFVAQFKPEMLASLEDVSAMSKKESPPLIDARSHDRFRGENETIDPIGGHIPGAVCGFYSENLNAEGTFKTANELRARYANLLNGRKMTEIVTYCGSGVSACHNVLAMTHAGLGMPRLFVGSWSQWITDPHREIEK
jgi:thiosulfate/3-mercaptopyruvate sulfurtransferase